MHATKLLDDFSTTFVMFESIAAHGIYQARPTSRALSSGSSGTDVPFK